MAKQRPNKRRSSPPRSPAVPVSPQGGARLAQALWDGGRRDEAVDQLFELLRSNPQDAFGLRHTLAARLLFLDRDDDLARLLQQFPEDNSAAWAYNKALLAFRQHGDAIDARRQLKMARKANKHVIDYLLGREVPAGVITHYRPGDAREAALYAAGTLVSWKSTDGAVAWLRAQSKAKKPVAEIAKGPLGVIKKWLNSHLPQHEDVWQADLCLLPNWVTIGGEFVRLSALLVTNRSTDHVLGHQLLDDAPTPALVWDVLAQAMQHPVVGQPHRPGELHVRPGEIWDSLRPHFEELGIRLITSERLDHLEVVFADMCEHVCAPARPGLVDIAGVTSEQVGRFYEAAALYFRRAAWKKVGDGSAIQVECDRLAGGPRYAVVMGEGGMTTGLALYDDLASLRRLWRTSASEEEAAAQTVATSVIFGEQWSIAVADLEAGKQHGWPVARADAYPHVLRADRGEAREPDAAELEIVEACLRAVPDFVDRRPRDDTSPFACQVPLGSGLANLTLSWVV